MHGGGGRGGGGGVVGGGVLSIYCFRTCGCQQLCVGCATLSKVANRRVLPQILVLVVLTTVAVQCQEWLCTLGLCVHNKYCKYCRCSIDVIWYDYEGKRSG